MSQVAAPTRARPTRAASRADTRAPAAAAPVTVSPIKDAVVTARYFKVLSDPTRLAILRLLLERERSVGELVDILQVPQSRVSNHLACLRWCNFVEFERPARKSIYRIADPRMEAVLDLVGPLAGEHCDVLSSCTRLGPDWI